MKSSKKVELIDLSKVPTFREMYIFWDTPEEMHQWARKKLMVPRKYLGYDEKKR